MFRVLRRFMSKANVGSCFRRKTKVYPAININAVLAAGMKLNSSRIVSKDIEKMNAELKRNESEDENVDDDEDEDEDESSARFDTFFDFITNSSEYQTRAAHLYSSITGYCFGEDGLSYSIRFFSDPSAQRIPMIFRRTLTSMNVNAQSLIQKQQKVAARREAILEERRQNVRRFQTQLQSQVKMTGIDDEKIAEKTLDVDRRKKQLKKLLCVTKHTRRYLV